MKKHTLDIAIVVCSIIVIILVVVLVWPTDKKELANSTNSKKEVTSEEKVEKEVAVNKEEEIQENSLLSDDTKATNEEEVVSYVSDVEARISNLDAESTNTTMKEKLENTFITLTDFIFYDGTIKGMTFDELTDTAKQEILELYEKIDSKIESYFPNYKENITSSAKKGYTTAVSKAKELKDTIVAKYKETVGEEEYNNVASNLEEDKNSLKDAYTPYVEKGKEIASQAVDKGKEVWNSTKDKLDSWYQNFKESRE